jgi:SAM-dependent methyltransferase
LVKPAPKGYLWFMAIDVVDLRSFYTAPLGHVARRYVGSAVAKFWPSVSGLRIAGIGFALPYLSLMREESERCMALMPARQGVVNWPSSGESASALVDPTMLPLPDLSLDRILLIHGLEVSDDPDALMEEAWRVLAPGGRLIVVAPNRRGLWARMDTTPFGHGHPYSRSQIERLMRNTLFTPEGWAEALYVPPFQKRGLIRSAALWETAGAKLGLPFAGVHVVDATKQLHRAVPVRRLRERFALRPLLIPSPEPSSRKIHVPKGGSIQVARVAAGAGPRLGG